MHTKFITGPGFHANAIGQAILAAEEQARRRREGANECAARQKKQFYVLLDSLSIRIFHEITQAIQGGKRELHLSRIPHFRQGCDSIFNLGFGIFDPDMLNEWLYAQDVRHVFHAAEGIITW